MERQRPDPIGCGIDPQGLGWPHELRLDDLSLVVGYEMMAGRLPEIRSFKAVRATETSPGRSSDQIHQLRSSNVLNPKIFAGKTYSVFDAYGTLFDVHSAVQRHADAIGPNSEQLSALWRGKQLEYSWVLGLIGRYEPFWSLTEQALDYALAQHPAVDRGLRTRLLDAYRDLDAYDEVPEVLERLRGAGLRTAIFSNGNQSMLDRAVATAGLGDRLDAVLSVDEVEVFKTAPAAYQLVLDRLGVAAEDILFCSSNRWDIAGAAAFGFTPVWVNRSGLPDEYPALPPAVEVKDLRGLL